MVEDDRIGEQGVGERQRVSEMTPLDDEVLRLITARVKAGGEGFGMGSNTADWSVFTSTNCIREWERGTLIVRNRGEGELRVGDLDRVYVSGTFGEQRNIVDQGVVIGRWGEQDQRIAYAPQRGHFVSLPSGKRGEGAIVPDGPIYHFGEGDIMQALRFASALTFEGAIDPQLAQQTRPGALERTRAFAQTVFSLGRRGQVAS